MARSVSSRPFDPSGYPRGGWGGHRIEAGGGGGVYFWVWLLVQASPITLKVDHKGAHNVDCADLGQLYEALMALVCIKGLRGLTGP